MSIEDDIFRELQSCKVARMPVAGYSAEERGTTNTDSYKIFVRDSEGEAKEGSTGDLDHIYRTHLPLP